MKNKFLIHVHLELQNQNNLLLVSVHTIKPITKHIIKKKIDVSLANFRNINFFIENNKYLNI